jgi:hypothetical protein
LKKSPVAPYTRNQTRKFGDRCLANLFSEDPRHFFLTIWKKTENWKIVGRIRVVTRYKIGLAGYTSIEPWCSTPSGPRYRTIGSRQAMWTTWARIMGLRGRLEAYPTLVSIHSH